MDKKPIEEFGWQQDEKDKNKYNKPTNVIVGGYISNIIFGKNGISLSIQHRDMPSEEIFAIYETAKMINKGER